MSQQDTLTLLFALGILAGYLAWLLAKRPAKPVKLHDPKRSQVYTLGPPLNIVAGEGHYAVALKKFTGPPRPGGYLIPKQVRLVREPENPFDPNAIKVTIAGQTVGHIRREVAEILSPQMDAQSLREFSTTGVIRGGYEDAPNIGVHLWFDRRAAAEAGLDANFLSHYEVSWPPGDDEGEGA